MKSRLGGIFVRHRRWAGAVRFALHAGVFLVSLWFGLLLGFLFTLFSEDSWIAIMLTAVLIGALWGGIFGAIAHALTGGRRDFTSRSSLQAGQYAVTVEAEVADEARVLITRATWRSANPS